MRLTRIFTVMVLLIGAPMTARAEAQRFAPAEIERGRALAIAGDCAACHTAPGRNQPAMAGGYPIASPLGTIFSTNITPSKSHGIGNYSEAQFSRALREGIRADGAQLYPAMPYTSYAGLSDEDVHALYAWFMRGVAPVDQTSPETKLPFPLNIRSSLKIWNALFLSTEKFKKDPRHDAQWNRGRYLAETLAHCSTCHSPRGLLMQEERNATLSGGQLGEWYAPNITSDRVGGIGGWTKAEIAQYLATGHVKGKAQAAGGMAEAVTNSFSRMPPADTDAIAAYIATVPAVPDPRARQASYSIGAPGRFEATLRGGAPNMDGARLYSGLCASCHGSSGSGTANGTLPSLYHNSTVGAVRADNLVAVILHGVDRTVGDNHVLMPGFGEGSHVQSLSDRQVAQVATFVRENFGPGGVVTEADAATARKGGPGSILLPAIRASMVVGAVVALALGIWLFRRRRRSGARAS